MQFIELLLRDLGGSAHEDILRVLVHRERDNLADGLFTGQQHDHAVHARGNARMGRRAVGEGVVHRGELLLDVGFAETNQLEGFDHDFGVMVPDRAGRELHAVADEVILVGSDGQRIDFAAFCLQKHLQTACGHRERVMAEFQLARFVADLIHREFDNPAELVALFVHMTRHVRAEDLDHDADKLRCRLARGDQHQRIGLKTQPRSQLVLAALHEFCNAAGQLAVFVRLEPVALDARLHLAVGQELFNLLARQVTVGNRNRLDRLALKCLKLGLCKQVADVLRGQVDAEVGLVRAVGLQRVDIADAAEGRTRCNVILAELCEDRRQHILENGEHVVLRGKCHLHIELIELTGAAVAAGVFVAEAGRDLEVAVEAGGHEQLLELLRRLRQGVELTGMLSGRNQIVARALGGGSGQNRGSDLLEIVLHHCLAQRGDDLAAQDDVLLDRGVAQVQIAVFEALGLVCVAAAVDFKRQLVVDALAENIDLLRHDLHIAGRLLGVFAGALAHGAGHRDGRFLVDGLDDVHHVLGLDDNLRRAVEIAQDDEGKVAAHDAHVFHPAAERDGFAGIGKTKLPAGVSSGLHHNGILLSYQNGCILDDCYFKIVP